MNRLKLDAGNVSIFIYGIEPINESVLLQEAKHRGVPLAGPYSVIKHSPHTPKNDYHLHVYVKNNELFAINRDGTAHDQSHGCQIPQVAADALKKLFPSFTFPKDNMLESAGVVEHLINL